MDKLSDVWMDGRKFVGVFLRMMRLLRETFFIVHQYTDGMSEKALQYREKQPGQKYPLPAFIALRGK